MLATFRRPPMALERSTAVHKLISKSYYAGRKTIDCSRKTRGNDEHTLNRQPRVYVCRLLHVLFPGGAYVLVRSVPHVRKKGVWKDLEEIVPK